MVLKNVTSSNIKAVGYDVVARQLQVEFNAGGIYSFDKVPESVYKTFMEDRSKGKFFLREIRGKYKFKKIK